MQRGEIIDLLTDLGGRLAARGIEGEMYVVGGAAIALAFDERRSTRDIDAVFEPKTVIYEVAGQLAGERGLPDGWLNDAVKGFLTGADPDAPLVLEVDGKEHRLGPDDAYQLTGDTPHAASAGPDGCRVLDLFQPVREDYRERWEAR